ncbi:hypothetical protein [Micromonospora sp. U21]|uniref:hypothetical protein n=1 Tax=Micromonospora sp. U21 TaxID=2824899 RepID=UPI001B37884B|nr:hypothetical protein [Micromonospora sp. U21]MBQ0905486.1 hypothetical protein [Micromonospora sp. U21]
MDVDLWRFRAAARHAAIAAVHQAAAWRAVIDSYTGDLAAGHTWPWLDPPREAARRHVIDAYAAVAAGQSDPRLTLSVLEAGIRVDPPTTRTFTTGRCEPSPPSATTPLSMTCSTATPGDLPRSDSNRAVTSMTLRPSSELATPPADKAPPAWLGTCRHGLSMMSRRRAPEPLQASG